MTQEKYPPQGYDVWIGFAVLWTVIFAFPGWCIMALPFPWGIYFNLIWFGLGYTIAGIGCYKRYKELHG